MELGEVNGSLSLVTSLDEGRGSNEKEQGSFLPPVGRSPPGGPAERGGGGGVGTDPPSQSFYTWKPLLSSPSTCPSHCDVCLHQFTNIAELCVHFHQYHLNPHHLAQEDRRKYRLSNFLINKHEDTESKTEFPGLYRCHECFNVFNLLNSLKSHLPTHSVERPLPANKMVVSKMPSKYSREDFEDVSPRKRNTRHYKENISDEEKMNNNHSINKRLRKRLKRTKFTDFYFEPSDSSDFDCDDFKIPAKKNKKKHREKRKPRKRETRDRSNEFSSRKIRKRYELQSVSDEKEEEEEEEVVKPLKKKQKHKDKKHSKLKSAARESQESQKRHTGLTNGHHPAPSLSGLMKTRAGKPEKKCGFKMLDHSKLHAVVEAVTQPRPEFLCLACSQGFSSFLRLSRHKQDCNLKTSQSSKLYHHIFPPGSKNPTEVKSEIVIDSSKELFEYVTGAVTSVPETTFNNMHGKIVDLNTEDARQLAVNQLNEIGLVKLNYSGNWSVKDVWESGCWEPREDQLSWQEYELSSELVRRRAESEGEQESQLTERLTTQIVGRKAPLITCRSVDRRLVTSMSRMPWTEQRMIKQRLDTNILGKRSKRASVGGEQPGAAMRQSNITSLLDLVQTGKSVKYMKQVEREALGRETKVSPLALQLDNGEMSGEWELEHSYMCTVCGVEYDDMMEILHHKWESHPNCLVAHVNVKDNVIKPPNLLFPQVGPSRVTEEEEEEESSPQVSAGILCSKCQQEFEAGAEGREKFHFHLLDCGGVQDVLDSGKKKKKKKRGMGGGLKSTVRMLKKSESVGEGTDTEEQQSPKKKVRPPARPVQPVPLIPTHQRTTRYKETMKKEAKKQAAKEKRQKAQQTRQRRARLSEETKIVAAVLDKVLSDVERLRAKKRRSTRGLESPVRATEGRRVSGSKHRRERTVTTYKEESSDSEKSSEESLKQKTPKKSSSRRNLESIPSQPPTPKLVVVKVSNDEDLYSVTDLSKSHVKSLQFENDENSTGDLSTEDEEGSRAASLECPRILKRLQTTLVTKMLTPLSSEGSDSRTTHSERYRRYQHPLEVKISALSRMENGEDHAEIASDLNITVSTLGAWWIRRSDIKLKYENKFTGVGQEEPASPGPRDRKIRNRARSLGPPEGKITKVGSDHEFPEEHLVERKKRGSRLSADSGGGGGGKGGSSGKNVYSLEFKLAVLERLRAGEEIPAVARSVRVRENTVSVWWLRRDRIQNRRDTDWKLRQRKPAVSASPVMTGRWLMPLEVKQTAIRRLEQGVTQATVARDLDVSLSTVASWWRKKDNILGSQHKPEEEEEGEEEEEEEEDAPLATSIDDMGVSELEHLMSDTDPTEEKHADQTVETVETMEPDKAIKSLDSSTDYTEENNVETVETNNTIEWVETMDNTLETMNTTADAVDTTVQSRESMKDVETMETAVGIPEAMEDVETMNTVEEDQTFDLVSVQSEECNEQSEAVPCHDEQSKDTDAQLEEETIESDQEETIHDCESDGEEEKPLPEREEPEPRLLSSLSSLSSTARPQSGLGLILSNYWSSDEEL